MPDTYVKLTEKASVNSVNSDAKMLIREAINNVDSLRWAPIPAGERDFIVTGSLDLSTLAITNLQHDGSACTFSDAQTAASADKRVVMQLTYTSPFGVTQVGYGDAVIVDSTLIQVSLILYANMGTGYKAYMLNVQWTSSSITATMIQLAESADIPSLSGYAKYALEAPLVASGGDSASAGKISLDKTQSGQITDESTSTLFGFLSNNTSDLTVGGTGLAMKLRGSAARPQYSQGSGTAADLALYGDLPSNPLTLSTRSSYDCDTRYDGKVWLVASGSHCPSGSQYGSLFTMPYRQATGNAKPDFGTQIFIPNGDDSTKPNSMFYRTSLANSWNPWKEVAVQGECNADTVDGYHVVVSNSAPASGTSNNIITIVT